MKSLKTLSTLIGALALSSLSAFGVVIDTTGSATERLFAEDLMLGYSFTTTGMNVAAVGIFDVGSDGLNSDHRVGVWDSWNNLIIDQIVSAAGPTAASLSGLGNWVLASLASDQFLSAGTYTVAAYYTGSSDSVLYNTTAVNSSFASYGQGKYKYTSTFSEPVQNYAPQENQYFGPGLFASVPDAGSSLTLLGLGLIGLSALRRKLS